MATPRLLERYRKDILPALKERFSYSTVAAVPRVEKVVVNVGTGRLAVVKDTKMMERIVKDLTTITGQKPAVRKAKKSIAGFKLREGLDVGYMVTLRGTRMYDFIDRLISLALPRTRDFQGIPATAFDQAGNLNIGIKEQTIFPEVAYDTLKDIFGLEVTVVTTAHTKEEGDELLRRMGFPLRSADEKRAVKAKKK
ncbi:MAG: 50S ribosomal protein L5 [Candidatus Yanofskybacteria bacterium RIFCSPLOWO2_01_FULL_49_25]|uniref:Large ribosomal subunit protein uL5 n=1 Tax=Candidatus Yanofskybacteria bacterium RIFCSPLOWO2_01_FULL_49_25 TaxID=1802701 RepID=A0A1F8GUT4_9BACT|nr:MAG: 50S ribosomal protein L5 [Candidatus Yanofskybacteria bacterium RIFCSPLOWO2_01_FULL_49_25]